MKNKQDESRVAPPFFLGKKKVLYMLNMVLTLFSSIVLYLFDS